MKQVLLVLVLISISPWFLRGQELTVRGTVSDTTTGSPLPGVSVTEEGTRAGVATGPDGGYTLTVSGRDAVLVFSFMGYQIKRVPVEGRAVMDIRLVPDAESLGEIVVVGYGTQQRATLTGSVVSVSNEDLVKVSNNDLTNSLTGRAPGIRVVQMSSEPGKFDSQIDIRGFSYTDPDDIQGRQSGWPLFVVDGVQRDKAAFDRLDPNVIESISVLKDASAAIYGVKAANGVILVTTKKGEAGKLRLSYTGQGGVQMITKYPELSNAYQYATMFNEMQINSQISSRSEFTQPKYSREEIEAFRTGEAVSTDFLGLIMRNSAPQQQHNLTVNGGSEKVRYFASAGYFDEGGLYRSDALWANKYNLRINVRAVLADGLDMGVNAGFINTIRNRTRTDSWLVLRNAWRLDPAEPAYANGDPDYLSQFESGLSHPLAQTSTDMSGYYRVNEKFLTSTFDLTYDLPFARGLRAKALLAYDFNYNNNKSFNKKFNQYEYLYDESTDSYYYQPFTYGNPSDLNETFGQGTRFDVQLSLNYDNSFGQHHVSGLFLYEQLERVDKGFNASTQFIIDAVDQLFAGIRAQDAVNSSYSESANRSYVGRVNYDYAGKYLAEFAFRYDGSSSFPKNSRWGFFPSVSAGWRISEEPFMKNNLGLLTNLKLRGSYGELGDDAAADFQFLTGYTYPDGGYQFGTEWKSGLGFKNSANPNITWYTSTMSNIGLEGSLWNDLLSFEVDFFRRDRDGLLAYRNTTIPATYGVNLPQENLNEDRTQGYELVLGHRNRVGEVGYTVSANITYARTKYRYQEETPASGTYNYWRHRYAYRYNDVIWGYKTDGQFQSFEEIRAAPVIDNAGNRSILPGDIKYVDLNGDGTINALDETVIGRGQSKPSIYFGMDIGITWKALDFSMLLQGATMYQVYYRDQLSRPFYWGTANPITEYWDRWHREDVFDPNSAWISGKYPSAGERQNYKVSEFWLRDASYLRIKSIEIGYTLPKRLTDKIKLQNLRIFANGYNVFTWTKGLDFVDPEYTDDRLYSYNYPITMNVNFGVQVNL